jgi:hypothetical protein
MRDEIKKLKYLIYEKNKLILQQKKELKQLLMELRSLEGEKTLTRKMKDYK